MAVRLGFFQRDGLAEAGLVSGSTVYIISEQIPACKLLFKAFFIYGTGKIYLLRSVSSVTEPVFEKSEIPVE